MLDFWPYDQAHVHAETAAVVGLDEEVGGMADGHVEDLIQAHLLSPVEGHTGG